MSTPASTSRTAEGLRPRRHRAWVAATALLVVVGVTASALAANAVARDDADESRKRFQSAAANVASTLELAIQHDDDMAVDAGAFLSDPTVTQAEFVAWTEAARTLQR